MSKTLPVVRDGVTTGQMVFCPACECGHEFNLVPAGGRPVWTFNNDIERPTFRASMLVRSGCKSGLHQPGDDCWCTYEARYGKPAPFACGVCHSVVTGGRIEFLADCTHALAGKTADLPDWADMEGRN